MDYTRLLNELNEATLFDLYRLRVAISNELENPQRLLALKQQLHLGKAIRYFCRVENKSFEATVVELRQKNVVVLDHLRQKRFSMPYCMLNLDQTETAIREETPLLSANNLSVGDHVRFTNRDGRHIVGVVTRLNHKTASVDARDGGQWRAGYGCLRRVHDTEIAMERLAMAE